jgi:cell division initiation protein
MTITPVELRNFQFSKKMRGYDPADVDAVIDEAAGELENLIAQNKALERELNRLKERLSAYESIEQSLRQALVTAEEAAKQQQESASREAEIRIKEADAAIERKQLESRDEIERAMRDLAALRQQRAAFVAEMKSLLETHLRLLTETHQAQADFSQELTSEGIGAGTSDNGRSEYGPGNQDQSG